MVPIKIMIELEENKCYHYGIKVHWSVPIVRGDILLDLYQVLVGVTIFEFSNC